MDPKSDDLRELFAKPADFERWLREHYAKASSIWVKYAKKKFFDSLSAANRYAILYRLQGAKKPETRARRLAKFVDMLHKGEKLHP